MNSSVKCPICNQFVTILGINAHLDSNCQTNIVQADGTIKNIINNRDINNNELITNKFQKINSNHIYLGANSVEKRKTVQSTLFSNLSNRKRSNDNILNKTIPNHSLSNFKSTFNNSNKNVDNNDNNSSHTDKKIKIEEKTSLQEFDINKKYNNNFNSNRISSMNNNSKKQLPLAELVRPRTLNDYFGQEEIMGNNSILKALIMENRVPSLILWGPPGVGKYI